MFNETAHFALILAFFMSMAGAVLPMMGAVTRNAAMMDFARVSAYVQLILVGLAFAVLTLAFVTSDFSLRIVLLNSHTLKPMLYKVAGVWGNHEGSLLLWVLILTGFASAVAFFGRGLPSTLKARVLGVQSSVTAAFLAFILWTSNPFERVPNPPFNGQGLNPLLQDPGLAFHPPFLYLGYVGLSVTFSFAVAALLEGRVDAAWARWVRPWTLAAWLFLTIGIALGSWWAYYELGWGGFWFWDPVENASFMPWLIAAALLHSAIVVEKREVLKAWTILLAILAFGFSLVGTFIVRSGVLTSVHAFANDPDRGVLILGIMAFFVGGALTLFAWRASALESRSVFSLISRESALVANNILLVISCFVVFVGTFWPLVAEMFFDRRLSVGPPFFNAAFTPFMVALATILPVGSTLAWKRGNIGRVFKSLLPTMIFALAVLGLVWAMQTGRSLIGPIGAALGVWLVMGAASEVWLRANKQVGRIKRLPASDWGKALAHAGLGITIFGIAALTAWEVEDIRVLDIGQSFEIAGKEITLRGVEDVIGPNFTSVAATFDITTPSGARDQIVAERRFYPVAQMPTTEAAILNGVLNDIYVVLGDAQDAGGWAVRSFVKPFANWIWAGAIIMAIGGLISLTDRRYRVAAGQRSGAGL